MKLFKAFYFLIFLATLCVAGCSENNDAKKVADQPITIPDTAQILSRLRTHDSMLAVNAPGRDTFLRSILNDAIRMKYNDEACNLLMDYARYYTDQGNFDSSLHYYNQAREYCNKPIFDKTLPAAYLAEFGAFYHSLRTDYVSANKAYYDALEYLKANDLTRSEMTVLLYIFLQGTQEELGHHDQALQYLQEGEKLAKEIGSKQALVGIWANMGDFYSKRENHPMAIKYFDSVLLHYNNTYDPNILSSVMIGKGMALTDIGKAEEAIPLLQKSLQHAKENQVIYSIEASTIALAGAYNKLGRHKEAIDLVEGSLKAQERGINFGKEEGYKVLTEAYEGVGDFKNALSYQRKLHDWQDSLGNIKKTNALNEMELKYQTANKDKEIERQKNIVTRNNTIIAGISIAAALAVLIFVMLYRNATNKQRIQQLEIKTLHDKQEIKILRSTMQGEEQERKRISQELHDGIGSMLASVIMRITLLKKRDPATITKKEVDDLSLSLQETAQEVRKTAQNITPDVLYKQTLFEAIKNYCASISHGTSLKIDVQYYGDETTFSSHCKLVIYRVIQELVHNIIKHSNATHAIVQAVNSDDNFTVTVEDNGSGFDQSKQTNGMGLQNVASRVRALQGEFRIDSEPGKGTAVYMEFRCKALQDE